MQSWYCVAFFTTPNVYGVNSRNWDCRVNMDGTKNLQGFVRCLDPLLLCTPTISTTTMTLWSTTSPEIIWKICVDLSTIFMKIGLDQETKPTPLAKHLSFGMCTTELNGGSTVPTIMLKVKNTLFPFQPFAFLATPSLHLNFAPFYPFLLLLLPSPHTHLPNCYLFGRE